MKKLSTFLILIFFFALTARAQIRYLKGTLSAAQEVPPTISGGGGVVIVKYNMATRVLEHYGNYRGLTDTITNQHIHTAPPGVAGPVTFQLTSSGGTVGTLTLPTGSQVLTPAQEADLLAGNMYTNVHTRTYPGGELRAQLTLTTDGQTVQLNARLQGAQQVPPNGSRATGMVDALIDKSTNMLYLTGSYSGLTKAANNAHIHKAPPNVSGPVIIPVNFSTATAGTLDTARLISAADRDSILSGNTYVNVHTDSFPAGEIRGQLTMLSQQRYFANALTTAAEVPPPPSSRARGTVIVTYDTLTNLFVLVGDYQNLSGIISGSHIHGPAGPGVNAPILFDLTNTGDTTGILTVSRTLTPAQEADLLAGNMYANVHSAIYPGGEIRAQLLPTSTFESHIFTGLAQGLQEVPPVATPGTGVPTVLLDRITNMVYVTAGFSGLTSNINNTHIHGGAAGTVGPVVVPLTYSGTTAGTVTGTATVRGTFADSMINGLTYFNIHTVTNGGGEIRAQLGSLTLPGKLTYFNGYKDRNQIALLWEASQEMDVKNYEVEQQNPENGDWVKKATISAAGGNTARKYRFDDIPVLGKKDYLLYRLKTIDIDGKFVYSSTIRISYAQSKAGLTIMPNPIISNKLRFTITGMASEQKAEISVIDFGGRTMLKTAASTLLNNNIDISKLSAVTYRLVIKMNDGKVLQETFSK
jgi:hypothetical protein